ncbi:DUF1049 domain-containing protein [Phytoactinopolyspora alkaliphila]|uniref:DUF1049 domain-containing protein n=1 Tax=Phytoactinopolyspora alkaliphila TaxID=1783498 RepID=A0A6N9YQ18_9ACTN|nr:lipopolysaccharide assembly protein LapA domain-containing protein [Phytoactinopolyspora alkaliphila]NED97035.1 DUF1049 domain-containing protein [Phytoactinopolyspora alkaliphila]
MSTLNNSGKPADHNDRGGDSPQAPADQNAPVSESADTPTPSTSKRVPRTRMGAAWVGICVATALFVILIVFMLQNTREVEVTFLWMEGSAPLALALLIAAAGTAILAAVIGGARIAQLRRHSRRQH